MEMWEINVGDVVEVYFPFPDESVITTVISTCATGTIWLDSRPGERYPQRVCDRQQVIRRFKPVSDEELIRYRIAAMALSAQLHFRGLQQSAQEFSAAIDNLTTVLDGATDDLAALGGPTPKVNDGIVGWWE